MTYQFHPAAASEHLDSIAFYESRLAGLGEDYIGEFEATLLRVCAASMSFSLDCPPDIRKAGLRCFLFKCFVSCSGRRSADSRSCTSPSSAWILVGGELR
jgi:hypothetical protein